MVVEEIEEEDNGNNDVEVEISHNLIEILNTFAEEEEEFSKL